jgi:proteasome lid subunit RPN8/RPN11
MANRLTIQREILQEMAAQAARAPSRECCGLLAGKSGLIARILPAANAAGNPAVAYEIAPLELLRLTRAMRAENLELLGIYHSHPTGDNAPSPTDIERAYYPDVAYFILSPRPDAPRSARAFSISRGHASELEIEIV